MVRPRTGRRQSAIPMRAKNASVLVSPKRSDHRGISCIQMRVKLLKQLASKLACCLALQTRPGIEGLEPRQGWLNDLSQFMAGERAVLFEREKSVETKQERRCGR